MCVETVSGGISPRDFQHTKPVEEDEQTYPTPTSFSLISKIDQHHCGVAVHSICPQESRTGERESVRVYCIRANGSVNHASSCEERSSDVTAFQNAAGMSSAGISPCASFGMSASLSG